MIPKQLISLLNSGRCVALVGSGPSAAMGYPSWKRMAAVAEGAVARATHGAYEHAEYKKLVEAFRLPELFDLAAEALGGVSELVKVMRPFLVPEHPTGRVYEYLARWPFRWYLTTNWDNELQQHLARAGQHFTVLGNRREELIALNDQTQRVVVKLHGTLEGVDGLVLTETQYQEFRVGDSRGYFREKLKALFSTLPVVVIGHSLTDPDLALILEYSQLISAPGRPIYMIVADAGKSDVRRFQEKYNIRIISYENSDGKHAHLNATLRMIDRVVIPRTSQAIPLDMPDPHEVEVASSLLLYSKLALGAGSVSLMRRAIEPQVLTALCAAHPGARTEPQILESIIPQAVTKHPEAAQHVAGSVVALCEAEYAATESSAVRATQAGVDRCSALATDKRVLEDQVYGALEARLKECVPVPEAAVVAKLVGSLRRSLVAAFRKRGLATSTLLFQGAQLERSDMAEVFESIMGGVSEVGDFEARTAYVEFVMDLLTKPSGPQRTYLSSVSQGFFAFHLFGQDPDGKRARAALAADTAWICDSNFLIPLLARGCHSHAFATDAMACMRALGVRPSTTAAFMDEAQAAFNWAQNNCMADGAGTVADVYKVTQRIDYYENLFIDGFIRGAEKEEWKTFGEYVKWLRCGTAESSARHLESVGLTVRDPAKYAGHDAGDAEAIRKLTNDIWRERVDRGSSRGGERQARAEAEALHIIRRIRDGHYRIDPKPRTAYFVSTSRLLDQMYPGDGLITFSPEALYRHLAFLVPTANDPEKLFESMATSYYAMNVSVVDDATYSRVFGSMIGSSKLEYEKEKEGYLASLEQDVRTKKELDESFARTPDIEKPMFVSQMAWSVARAEGERRAKAEARASELKRALESERAAADVARDRRVVDAEGRANALAAELAAAKREAKEALERQRLELEKKEADRMRQEEARLRNARDPSHVRRRLRQAKKRNK